MNEDFTWMVRCKCVADIGNMVSGCTMGKNARWWRFCWQTIGTAIHANVTHAIYLTLVEDHVYHFYGNAIH